MNQSRQENVLKFAFGSNSGPQMHNKASWINHGVNANDGAVRTELRLKWDESRIVNGFAKTINMGLHECCCLTDVDGSQFEARLHINSVSASSE